MTMQPSVIQTKFGDGYELRVTQGINFKPRSWAATFSKGSSEAADILAFLEARAAVEAFYWTDPLGNAGTFVCRQWSVAQSAFGVYSVSATFDQVFEQ